MMIGPRLVLPVALAILVSCRPSAPPSAIDPALSARVPPASVSLAGFDLDRLRASPLYAKLPPAAATFLAPFDHAHQLLIASGGGELLVIARGVVPGSTQVAPDVALSGSPALIAAATAAHPSAGILAVAETVAPSRPAWAAIRGGAALPLHGNWANLNNLLRDTDYVTLALDLGDPVEFTAVAQCLAPEDALRFEQSLHAVISLATATLVRRPATAGVIQSIRIVREDRVVRVHLSAPADELARLVF